MQDAEIKISDSKDQLNFKQLDLKLAINIHKQKTITMVLSFEYLGYFYFNYIIIPNHFC